MMFGKKELMDDIQSLLVTHGFRVICSESRPSQYSLSITKRKYAIVAHNDRTRYVTDYNGIVWCIQTANGTIVVRRNGRVAITGNSKEAVARTNWDNFLYKELETSLQNQKNIKINVSTDFYQLATIRGFRFFLIHGDQVRANQGVPLFALRRKYQEYYAYVGGFHYAYNGHWHVGGKDHINSIADYTMCPPLVTGDDWALEVIGRASSPVQLAFGIHSHFGRTFEYCLQTDRGFLPQPINGDTVKIEQK